MQKQLTTRSLTLPFLTVPFLALLACQGTTETTGQQESLICSGSDAPIYTNRFAPQSGGSGVATAPEAVAGKISSDAPTGGAPTYVGPTSVPTGSDAPVDGGPAPAVADAGTGSDAGGGLITAMIGTCGPSPCGPGQVAVEAPPKVAAATGAATAGPASAPIAPVSSPPAAADPSPAPAATPTVALVCAQPPPVCPQGQSPQFTMKQTWECTDCSLVVTYGAAYGNYRRCVNMPQIQCPDGQVPTWVFEDEQWECKTTCDNGQYDQHVAQGLLVCVPC